MIPLREKMRIESRISKKAVIEVIKKSTWREK